MNPTERERIGEVLAEALRRPVADREVFVAEACKGDAELEGEVRSLMGAAGSAGAFLERPTIAEGRLGGAAAEGPGAMIGRYRLLEKIGEGGFGTVFMAEQREPVQRRVAVKVIRAGLDSGQVVARFEAERQALAMMEHPNIARVLDGGETTGGRPYFVMELVRGEPITRYCDDQSLPAAERLALFAQVCRAVQHAHTKGIIHRDLKPGNVLVTTVDGRPVPKVIDFGIAKATSGPPGGGGGAGRTVFTECRQMIGTPEYMSPEQAEMSGVDIDTRSDIYSLGVMLYELLTGVTPFDPERLRAASWEELQRIIREEDPPAPSTRLSLMGERLRAVAERRRVVPGRLAPLVRGDLDWIVMKCLEKERARRYETAGALGDDLERHAAGEPVLAAPPSMVYRARRFVRRHRVSVGAGALVGFTLAAGVVGTAIGLVQAQGQRDRALAAEGEQSRLRRRAETERDKFSAVNGFLAAMLGAVDPRNAGGNRGVTVREVLDEAARSLDSGRMAGQPLVEESVRATLGRTYLELGRHEAAREQLDKALALLPADDEFVRERIEVLTVVARVELERSRPKEAEGWARRALENAEGTLGPDHRDTAVSLGTLATCLNALGRPEEAEAMHRRQLQILMTAPSPDGTRDEDLSAALNNLAVMADHRGRLDEAITLMRQAVEHARAAHGAGDPETLVRQRNLASMLRRSGNMEEAGDVLKALVTDSVRIFGERHMKTGVAYNELAMFLGTRGDRTGAEEALNHAVPILAEQLGDSAIQVVSARANLARVMELQGRREEAARLRRMLVSHFQACEVESFPERTDNLLRLGQDELALGRPSDAEATLRSAVALADQKLPDGHAFAWIRYNAMSVLGEVEQTLALSAPGEEQKQRFLEAERLLLTAAERISPPPSAAAVRRGAMERVVKFYEAWDRAEPEGGHAASAEQWRSRIAETTTPGDRERR